MPVIFLPRIKSPFPLASPVPYVCIAIQLNAYETMLHAVVFDP
jgi:hypothetical protein